MNFEHLCAQIWKKKNLLKNKKKTFTLLKYHFELLTNKKKKLKLGAIAFEINEFNSFNDKNKFITPLYNNISIRYTQQDNTEQDKLKLENILKSFQWKWDISNILAFSIIFLTFIIYVYININFWYEINFTIPNFKNFQNSSTITYFFNNFFFPSSPIKNFIFKKSIQILIDNLINLTTIFNFI